MHSFRQKVFAGYVLALLLLLMLMVPFVTSSVHHLVYYSMRSRANDLINKLSAATSENQIISILKEEKHFHFFRVSITNSNHKVLYDSHVRDLKKYALISTLFPASFYAHPEVEEAFQKGEGYSEQYSYLLGQKLIYIAKKFDFQNQTYVLRLAFPYLYIQDLRDTFTFGFFLFSSLVLILFAFVTAFIVSRLAAPISQITKEIGKYKEGQLETLPSIELTRPPQDEFSMLAKTLNSLSNQLKKEFQTITYERNERDTILESINAGVIALDKECSILYLNSTAKELLSLRENSTNVHLLSSIPLELPPLIEAAEEHQEAIIRDLELKKGNETRHLNLIIMPKENGQGAILVLHDRSDEYKMLEMRKAFIANASHELKTPITIIRGFAETLNDHPDLPLATIQDVTKRITDSCARMTSLIKNLLLLSDIENLPSHNFIEIDLIDLIHRCFDTITHAWPTAQLSLESPTTTVPIQAAPELLEMAITNLLDNGVKYSEQPAECIIQIKQKNGKVVIEIQDKGIGIPKEDLPHIFQRFFRGSKAGLKKYSGSGLGLSITETIVSKHHGTIAITSEPNLGTTCTITLPIRKMV